MTAKFALSSLYYEESLESLSSYEEGLLSMERIGNAETGRFRKRKP